MPTINEAAEHFLTSKRVASPTPRPATAASRASPSSTGAASACSPRRPTADTWWCASRSWPATSRRRS